MSEKQFTYGETIDYNFFDVFEEKKYVGMIQRDSTKIVDRLNEQQAEIDDLKEENEQLMEINKELGDDLYNCRLNKNIIREKLKLWQDVHKKYGIYSIKDFEESFELDAKINKEKGI